MEDYTYEELDKMSLEEINSLSPDEKWSLRESWYINTLFERRFQALLKDKSFNEMLNYVGASQADIESYAYILNSSPNHIREEFYKSYKLLADVSRDVNNILSSSNKNNISELNKVINNSVNRVNQCEAIGAKYVKEVSEVLMDQFLKRNTTIGEVLRLQEEMERVINNMKHEANKVINHKNKLLENELRR